jgi:hypothetical protein
MVFGDTEKYQGYSFFKYLISGKPMKKRDAV